MTIKALEAQAAIKPMVICEAAIVDSIPTIVLNMPKDTESDYDPSKVKLCEAAAPISRVSLGEFKITAYCNCRKCCGKWSKYNKTFSGTTPEQGRTIAVDPKVIDLGTHVIINGKEYIAEDTGSAVKGNHIDIYFNSHAEAKRFGLQKAEVFLK